MEQQFVDRRASLLANKIARTNSFIQRQNIQKVPVTFEGEQLDFIRLAMVDGINEDALRTIDFHQRCLGAEIDNGRQYWCMKKGDEIIGLSGFHYRLWDPKSIVWGGWFVAQPNASAMTKIAMLLDTLKVLLEETNYQQLYIEVFADTEQSNILGIYQSLLFTELSRFESFYGPNQDMVVMKLELDDLRKHWLDVTRCQQLVQ
ncbi:hypothetical protein J8L98_17600 [Pseudoalteromonas sp. MMG013]|uniref:N-acetyltransferase domain-containing protein n=1 Tax=Pseudoalteromonas aurantia 208 TaxID=1314867 RepID=A0ABR9EKT9_9GAMM|nr:MULTISPECIES: hypothetical protein [Pseudoalteromonas]MBE0370338.1 hypothetical protein [Pseudoalteromonas aurantia 208]MBQ4845304.1 hypothetical protein [Pseudoalteromonas sp. MMG005]MBQ4863500.1 hypothetical protein [Pseudoalteromonas sp. MMG013]